MTGNRNNNRENGSQVLSQDTDQALVDKAFTWFERRVLNSHKVHEDSTIRRRVVLLSVITFIGTTTLLFFGFLAFRQGAHLLASFDIVFALAFILNLLDARIRKDYQLNIVIGIIIASSLYIFLYVNGGVNRTAFVWYFTFPLMASCLLGSKKGALAMLLMAIPVIALLLLDLRHPFFASYTQAFEIRFLGAYLLVGVFAYIFEKAGENSRQETLEINKNLENIVEDRTAQLTSLNQNLLKEVEQHKQAQELLTQSEQRYRALIDLAAVGILVGSHDGHVLEANKCICDIVGVERDDLIGRHISELAFTEESLNREPFRFDLLKAGDSVYRERDILHPDGTLVTVEMRTVMMPDSTYQSIFTDITDRKREEEEKVRVEGLLQQAQKMEAVGTLAGGIAHDFNNLLMGIQGRTSLMAVDPQQSDSALEHVRAIDEHVRSASNLTNQLLGAARGGKYDPRPTDLSELIESSSVMFGRTCKEITIHTHYSKTAVVAVVDRTQIEQVLLNLYVNAWQAMPDGGDLHIESGIVFLESEYCELHQVEPGHFAKLSVADSGVGMDEIIQQQIFDPFFTTKEKGRGTGLGLASAYGIIKNHEGFITVHSKLGQGTTFTLYLPLSEMNPQQDNPTEAITVKGSEIILLVDDEEMIIEVGQSMLQALGYTVICAQGGEEAIRRVEEAGMEIDLVILDLIMPEIDGGRTFDRIREICPLIPVILASGYAIDGQAAEIMARGCNGFIQKPFDLSELSQKIRSVIDKKG